MDGRRDSDTVTTLISRDQRIGNSCSLANLSYKFIGKRAKFPLKLGHIPNFRTCQFLVNNLAQSRICIDYIWPPYTHPKKCFIQSYISSDSILRLITITRYNLSYVHLDPACVSRSSTQQYAILGYTKYIKMNKQGPFKWAHQKKDQQGVLLGRRGRTHFYS